MASAGRRGRADRASIIDSRVDEGCSPGILNEGIGTLVHASGISRSGGRGRATCGRRYG
jgi:hypothetical protein